MSDYPKLPRTVMGAAGPITVVHQAKVTYRGEECWGLWDDATRTITICSGATLSHQWRILFHEETHAALSDSGVDCVLGVKTVELICVAMSTARTRERFG